MKKQLLNLSFVAVALALYVASYAAPIEPVRTMVIPSAAAGVPALDGVAEDVYGDVQTTNIFNPTGYDGESDFTATLQVCYTPENLYAFVQITDDVDHSYEWTVGNAWEFDNVEFFLMLDTATVPSSYTGTTVQLRVCRTLDSVESAGRAPRTAFGYYMEAAAAGGWIAEVAIPWTAVLAEGAVIDDFMDYVNVDATIGFDFGAADSDNSDGDATVGNRDVQAAWDDDDPSDEADRTEDLAWNNTATFGYVTLQTWTAIDEMTQSTLNAYPNPADDMITFDVEGEVSIEIYSITGSLVMTSATNKVDISGLNSGVYVARNGNSSFRFMKK
ncbi:MAG: T9SS type A sorting domain-containing protein [Bacteroidales bacterium]|nr:T9SS type A sorting domain-containing protein [Bacteroidales bacterium]